MVFCTNCGKEGHGKFCTECGSNLGAAPAPAPTPAAAPAPQQAKLPPETVAAAAAAPATTEAVPVAIAVAEASTDCAEGALKPVSASIFQRYDQVAGELESLKGSVATLPRMEQDMAELNRQIQGTQNSLHKKKEKLGKETKSLEKNKDKPGAGFGIFLKSEKKVQGLEQKVAGLQGEVAQMESSLQHMMAQQQQLSQQLASASGAAQRSHQLQQERDKLFRQVLEPQPLTKEQRALRQRAQSARALKGQVDQTLATCAQAKQCFAQAMEMQQRAARSNMGAVVTQRGMESAMVIRRNQMMKAAFEPALRGSDLLTLAFQHFPQEAKVKYPSLTAQIGAVPVPNLRAGNFGRYMVAGALLGNVGQTAEQFSAQRQIRENMEATQYCLQLTEQQMALIRALLATLEGEVHQCEAEDHNIKNMLFVQVRSISGA